MHPVLDSVDVLVVGGGPAGIGAALGAARAGADTMLVENHSFFGGVGAWMMGMEINQMRPGGKPRSVVHELLIEKLVACGDEAVVIGTVHGHELWCNVEYLKVAIVDALDAAGARYLVHIRAVDAVVEGHRVTGVIVGTKRGLMTIRAKVVVDCTGDADVASFAGAETMIEAKSLMPATLGLALANVDGAKVKSADIVSAIRRGRTKHPLIPAGFLEIRPIARSRSMWFINHSGTADMGRVDVTDPVERTRAECQSRRQALQMARALREAENPSLQQIEWAGAGPQVSVRESRRVKGLYVITEQDTRTGQRFDDAVAWRAGWMDPGGEVGGPSGDMKTYHVPYRALVPRRSTGCWWPGGASPRRTWPRRRRRAWGTAWLPGTRLAWLHRRLPRGESNRARSTSQTCRPGCAPTESPWTSEEERHPATDVLSRSNVRLADACAIAAWRTAKSGVHP